MSRLSLARNARLSHIQAIETPLDLERIIEMRDEIDGRLWVAHHDEFSQSINAAFSRLRSTLTRLPAWDGTTVQLLALVAAFAVTALTFNTTAA
jgi:hypothetical protein